MLSHHGKCIKTNNPSLPKYRIKGDEDNRDDYRVNIKRAVGLKVHITKGEKPAFNRRSRKFGNDNTAEHTHQEDNPYTVDE